VFVSRSKFIIKTESNKQMVDEREPGMRITELPGEVETEA